MKPIGLLAPTVAILLAMLTPAFGDDAAQVIKSAKAATALAVLPNDRGSGTAFCIDASGLFVTNAHVAKHVGDRETIALVLNSADAGEKRINAKVLASDEAHDLALLQASEGNDFATLALGDATSLVETQQLTVLGFPFGDALSTKKNKNPNITVNVVRISSLRKSADTVETIQLDSQLNPGNSGGPIIDSGGKVVGIVQSGIVGGGINFAIPVSDLRTFLGTPRISFTPPTISEDKRTQPVELTIGVISLEKDAQPPLTVQVVLNPGTADERVSDAKATTGGQYKVQVVPVIRTESSRLRATISLADSVIRATVDDQTIKLDGKEFKLSGVSKIERNAGNIVIVARDGAETKGRSLTMATIKAAVGGQTMTIDSAKVDRIVVYANEGETIPIPYNVVVRRGDKVLATQSGDLGAPVATAQATEPTTQADDAILARLEDAKEDHQRSVQKAKGKVLAVVDARLEAATKRGDLDAVKSLEGAKQSIESENKLPESVKDTAIVAAMNACASEVKQANARLSAAYQQAIRDYTKARKTSQAEAVRAEMTERLPASVAASGGAGGSGAGYIKLGGGSRLPSFLEPNPTAFSEGSGLQLEGENVIRTRDGTLFTQDFTFDLVYSFKPHVDTIGVVGFGEGAGKRNALFLRLHSPSLAGGFVGFGSQGVPEVHLTEVTTEGPHLLRIEKKGDSLTVSLCINYQGTFTADATRTITDLKTTFPFLNAKNTYLFFGRGNWIFHEVRLVKSTSR